MLEVQLAALQRQHAAPTFSSRSSVPNNQRRQRCNLPLEGGELHRHVNSSEQYYELTKNAIHYPNNAINQPNYSTHSPDKFRGPSLVQHLIRGYSINIATCFCCISMG